MGFRIITRSTQLAKINPHRGGQLNQLSIIVTSSTEQVQKVCNCPNILVASFYILHAHPTQSIGLFVCVLLLHRLFVRDMERILGAYCGSVPPDLLVFFSLCLKYFWVFFSLSAPPAAFNKSFCQAWLIISRRKIQNPC